METVLEKMLPKYNDAAGFVQSCLGSLCCKITTRTISIFIDGHNKDVNSIHPFHEELGLCSTFNAHEYPTLILFLNTNPVKNLSGINYFKIFNLYFTYTILR